MDGFVYLLDRQLTVSNQALVFMVRGLAASWKQAVAFYFSENAASVYFLRVLLFKVLDAIFSINLTPVESLYQTLEVKEDCPFFEVSRVFENVKNMTML